MTSDLITRLEQAEAGSREDFPDWYPHWRERPARIGRTKDWKDCAHCRHKSAYQGMGVRLCVFQAQPADCGRYAYTFHPWLRADGLMWWSHPAPENYDENGLPVDTGNPALRAIKDGEHG